METSDSECFESADEELAADVNDHARKKTIIPAIERLKLADESIVSSNKQDTLKQSLSSKENQPQKHKREQRKLGTKVVAQGGSKTAELASNSEIVEKKDAENAVEAAVKQEENMWEDDEWPSVNTPEKSKAEIVSEPQKSDYSWGRWGKWGTSLVSTATTLTNQVSQGLSTALESGIGAPEPEELARVNKGESGNESSDSGLGFGSIFSGVTHITKLVETTGNKVITSGLGTLETIGKKTMEVLQEGDPGLKKKRAFLKIDDKPVLSQILREAKEKAETENKQTEQCERKKINYETLFDDHQGLVHLEALEMLSKQCHIKLQTLLELQSGVELSEMHETLTQIKELCELMEDDEEEVTLEEIREKLEGAASEMSIPISYKKLVTTWEESKESLDSVDLKICSHIELHEQSINILAQLTAVAVELFHKTGELLLVKERRSTVDEADSLVQLTISMTALVGSVAKNVTEKLCKTQTGSKEEINELITNVYYEATNSCTYIKNAFQLLIPVVQVGAV